MDTMLISNIVECIINDTREREKEVHPFLTGLITVTIDDDYTWVLTEDTVININRWIDYEAVKFETEWKDNHPLTLK